MGKIKSILSDDSIVGLILMGDFNCGPGSGFCRELEAMCISESLLVHAVDVLPVDTFTHVNNSRLTRKWLDYCVVSENLISSVSHTEVLYDFSCLDHSPFRINFDMKPYTLDDSKKLFFLGLSQGGESIYARCGGLTRRKTLRSYQNFVYKNSLNSP